MSRIVFTVANLESPENPHELGGYKARIYLDRELALKAKNRKLTVDEIKTFQRLGRERVLSRLWPERLMPEPYRFYEDSLLIQACHVGSNCCCMHASAIDILCLDKTFPNNPIEYNAHNVDNLAQQFGLLSLFSLWVDYNDVFLKP